MAPQPNRSNEGKSTMQAYLLDTADEDLGVRYFGDLNEGFYISPDMTQAELDAVRAWFRLRRALANLSRFPDGYEVAIPLPSGQQNIIAAPPDLVAVQREDGTWFRRARNITNDGAMPCTLDCYQEYLNANILPYYFLRPELSYLLEGDAEADDLEIADSLGTLPDPDSNFMRRTHPHTVQYLLPDTDVATEATPVDLTPEQQERLALRFPATTINARVFNDYRVYILHSGHIMVRFKRGTVVDATDPSQLRSIGETVSSYLASYCFEGRRMGLTAASNSDRSVERGEAERDGGGVVDSDEQPNGIGQWDWLNPNVNREIALQYGLRTPEEVMRARENGTLTNVPYNHRPLTVWHPDIRFINPDAQPQGQGRSEYATTPSRDEAWMNHGGQDHFPSQPHPTATQIWDLRRRMRDEIARGDRVDDTTASIDLVWVPATPPSDIVMAPPARDPTPTPTPTHTPDPQDRDVRDPDTGLDHDVTNGGLHDQSGEPGERYLQTIKINGRRYTVDRSRAQRNKVQEWKTWAIKKGGAWFQYKHYATLDWTSSKSMTALNSWREQALTRIGFPIRRLFRDDYNDAELDWMFAIVQANNSDRPPNGQQGMRDLRDRFNQHFNAERGEGGIMSLYDHLRDEYAENPDERKERNRRTNKKPTQKRKGTQKKGLTKTMDENKDDDKEDPKLLKGEEEEDEKDEDVGSADEDDEEEDQDE